jgi:hypothetical protein
MRADESDYRPVEFEKALTQDALFDNENPDFSDIEGTEFREGGLIPDEEIRNPIFARTPIEAIPEEEEEGDADSHAAAAAAEAEATVIGNIEGEVIIRQVELANAVVSEHAEQTLADRVKQRREAAAIAAAEARTAAAARAAAAEAAAAAKAASAQAEAAARLLSQGPPTEISGKSIGRKLIYRGVRLEKLSPDGQYTKIHGPIPTTGTCALCGFPFVNRQSARKKGGGISISYDHFIPVNFAAVVFRVAASATSTYTQREFELMGLIGDMVCWHCNYEKSQRMFLTCRNRGDFSEMQPNRRTIEQFFRDLLKSTHADAYSGSDRETTTLKDCLGPGPNEDWIKARTEVAVRRAQAICDAIKANVDYFKVRQRLSATKRIVAVVDTGLQSDQSYQKMDAKHKTRYRSSLIAKRFADAELLLPSPWTFDTPTASKQASPSSPVRPSPVTSFNARGRKIDRSKQSSRDTSRPREAGVISALKSLIADGKDTQPYLDRLSTRDKQAATLWLAGQERNKGGGAPSSRRVSGGRRKTHRRRKLPKLL